jgi:hypothetical protein
MLGIDLGGDEHRGVAERTRVIDRGDLADDAIRQESCNAREHLLLGALGGRRDGGVRPRVQRKAALHQVQQPAVEVVERDRCAVLAGAHLRRGDQVWASHLAASSAW